MALLSLAVLAPVSAAQAASSPGGAVAAAWPAAWNSYRYSDGVVIADNNTDQNPSTLDLASGTCAGNCVGPDSSVLYASDGTNGFFRIRLATNIADNSKGGLVGGAFLVQLAVSDVVRAVVGVDGKSSSVDYVYVADSVGGTVNTVYTYPFDSSGGQSSAGMRVVAAADGTGQYFLDFQVPLSIITTVSGSAITSSTAIKMYYGSSAAANLAVINKDFMAGDVTSVDFSNLATVSLSPAALSISSGAVSASGTNPPTAGQASSYTVTVTASNPGGGDLSNASVTIPVPAGVVVTSPSTATGTISGSPLVWNIGTILPGASKTATFTATITPSAGDVGTTMTLVSVQSGTGSDVPMSATRTASAVAIVLGAVVAAPPVTWAVTFNSTGGSSVSGQTINDGGTVTEPADPTRAGYTFDGWFTSAIGGSAWDFSTGTVTSATTLYAHWTAITWAVTFDSTGGSSVTGQTINDGGTVTEPADPTRAGYTFDGWFTSAIGGSAWDFSTGTVTSATTLYAHWTAITWAVTFDSTGGSSVTGQTISDGGTVTEPADPTRAGYTFDGWYTASSGGTAWDFSTGTVTSATTLYAHWTAITWAVTFDSTGGSSVSGQTINDGGTVTQPADPTRSGYVFDGWFTAPSGGSAWDFSTDTITSDTTIYAQWTAVPPGSWAVTFDSNGGSSVPGQSVVDGGTATQPTDPTRAGYTFDGWFTAPSGGSVWDFTKDTVTGDTTIYARWTAITWAVTFDSNGGSSVSGQTVADGGTVTTPSAPTRAGYTFDGWFTAPSGGSVWDFTNDTVTGDTTIYAQWTAVPPGSWAVTFDGNGGTSVSGQSVADGGLVTEPADPTRTGYTFDGWFTAPSGGSAWDFTNDTVTGDTTIYAQWTAVPPVTWAVTFNSTGGSAVSGQTISDGGTVTEPTDPTRSGFVFAGWFTSPGGGTAWDFSTGTVGSDTTLYAHWTPVMRALVFDSLGGTGVPGQSVADGGHGISPTPPTRKGYEFAGWFTSPVGGTEWDFATGTLASDLTLYAHWTALATSPTALAATGFDSSPSFAVGILLAALGALLLIGRRRPGTQP